VSLDPPLEGEGGGREERGGEGTGGRARRRGGGKGKEGGIITHIGGMITWQPWKRHCTALRRD